LLDESGAPRGSRRFFLFNPPVVNAELGIRASYVKQAVMLAADLVRAHVPTIVFGQSRNNVEVMLRYLRDKLAIPDGGVPIDPDNVEILVQHLKCAAFELPFKRGEAFGSLGVEETSDALGFLVQHKVLHESGGTFHWAADAYPANEVSLRSIGWDNVVIID